MEVVGLVAGTVKFVFAQQEGLGQRQVAVDKDWRAAVVAVHSHLCWQAVFVWQTKVVQVAWEAVKFAGCSRLAKGVQWPRDYCAHRMHRTGAGCGLMLELGLSVRTVIAGGCKDERQQT